MSDKTGPSTYQERREAKRYIEQRLRELNISTWQIQKGLSSPLPAKIASAKRVIAAFERKMSRQASTLTRRYEKKSAPIREDLIMSRFQDALIKLKGLEKLRVSIMKKGRFED